MQLWILSKEGFLDGTIPKALHFRQWYLPTIQKAHESDLQAIVDEADSVALIVDETSDNDGERMALNILFIPIIAEKSDHKLVSYIADQIYVDKLDHKIVAK